MANTRTQAKTQKKQTCPKTAYQKVSFDLKLTIIDRIQNGQISVNHAAELYQISRSSINYWMQKLSTFAQTKKGMSKNDELKKLRERNQELEFINDLQKDMIVDFEKITGVELSKKYLPEALAADIAKRKKSLSK